MACREEKFHDEMKSLFEEDFMHFDEYGRLDVLEFFVSVQKKLDNDQLPFCDPYLSCEENFKNGILFTLDNVLNILKGSCTKAIFPLHPKNP